MTLSRIREQEGFWYVGANRYAVFRVTRYLFNGHDIIPVYMPVVRLVTPDTKVEFMPVYGRLVCPWEEP